MKKRVSIVPLLIITGLSIFTGMWIFQGLKLVIHPTMTRDESQFITIIFNTLLATVVMYFVMLKKNWGQPLNKIVKRVQVDFLKPAPFFCCPPQLFQISFFRDNFSHLHSLLTMLAVPS
jgi:hypothetical protein